MRCSWVLGVPCAEGEGSTTFLVEALRLLWCGTDRSLSKQATESSCDLLIKIERMIDSVWAHVCFIGSLANSDKWNNPTIEFPFCRESAPV